MILDAFPKTRLIIETGIYVDYPAHYLWDRNSRLGPLFEAMSAWAAEHGHAVLDVFHAMKRETERGNWDLRIRGIPTAELAVVDDSFDGFYGTDPAFFTNIHPNSRCLALIADWQVALLKSLFGAALPTE